MTPLVMDTGVFVAGVFWRHEPHRCVQAWLRGIVALVVSDPIFEEYERELREVKTEQEFTTDLEPWLDAVRRTAIWVTPAPLNRAVCRDAHDDKFIEAALASGAKTIIARDDDLTVLRQPFGIQIVTPRAWLGTLSRAQRRQLV